MLEPFHLIQGFFDWEPLYDAIAAELPRGGTFVEVGVWRGKSLAYLLCQLRAIRKPATVFGVDHFRGSVEEASLGEFAAVVDVEAECRRNLALTGYPVTVLALESLAAAALFDDQSCDAVFIDGSHDYESVSADLAAWRPKLKPGGRLAGHDFNQTGVARAVEEQLGFAGLEVGLAEPWEWGLAWSWRVPS